MEENRRLSIIDYLFFMYCFFPFSFKIMHSVQLLLVYGCCLFYILKNFKYLFTDLASDLIIVVLILFILVICLLMLLPINTMDFSYLKNFFGYFRSIILILCMEIVLQKKEINSFNQIAKVYINTMCLYVFFSIVLLIPSIRSIWSSILFQLESNEKITSIVFYYTRFGLQGFSGWVHTILCSLGVSLFWILKISNYKISHIKLLLCLLGCAFYGRTGLLVALLCSLLSCFLAIKYHKFKYIFLCFTIGIVLLLLLNIYIEYFMDENSSLYWILEPAINKLQGKEASGSSNVLKDMYHTVHIDTLKELLIGYGRYTDYDGQHYFQRVDIGWARPMLFGGLLFETVYYLELMLLIICASNLCPKNIRNIFILMIITQTLFFELKGEAFFSVSRLLLLFCFPKKNITRSLLCAH